MLWQIDAPFCQNEKIIKCLLTTFLSLYYSLITSNQMVFGILELFMYHSFDYGKEENRKIVVVKLFVGKTITVVLSYVGIKSTDAVKCYDCSIRRHVHVCRANIVRLYNQYMGRFIIYKLDSN